MAIGDNNEKYYAPIYGDPDFAPTTYASQDYGGGGYWDGDYYDPDAASAPKKTATEKAMSEAYQEFKKREGGEHDPNPPSGKEVARTAENNYGYEDLGLLGDISSIAGKVIGGPVGMVLGMPNRLESIANINTVPAAREDLGLKAGKKTSVIGAAVKGTPTHVGTVNIGNATYNVDVDPKTWGKIDPVTGVTTIGPAEAKKNAIENQQQITEVEAPEEAPSAPKGPLGKALAAAKEALTGVKEAPTEQETPSTPSAPAIGATPGYNPDAPSPAQNVGLNAQPSNPAETSRSITPGLGLGNLTPTRDVTATAPVAGGISHLGGVANVGKRNTKDVPGLQDKTTVQNTPQEQRGTISSANPAGKGRYASPEANTMQGVANVMADVMGPDYGLSINSGTYTPAHAQKIEATRVAATQQAKSMGLTGQALKDHVKDAVSAVGGVGSPRHSTTLAGDYTASQIGSGKKATRAQMAAFANEAFSKGYSVGYGKNYMGEDVVHIDDTRPTNPNYWGGFTPTKDAMAASRNVAQQRGIMADYSGIGVPGTREMALQGLETPADQLSNVAAGVPSAIADVGVTEARNKDDTVTPSAYSPSVAENPSLDSMSNVTAGIGGMTPGLSMGTVSPDASTTAGVTAGYDANEEADRGYGLTGYGVSAMNAGYTPGTAMSAANFGAVGMGVQPSAENIREMSYTFAGELSPSALAGIATNNPAAMSQLGAMVAGAQNRAVAKQGMKMSNPIGAVLSESYTDPKTQKTTYQYDSMNPANQTVTAGNYARYGTALQEAIKGIVDNPASITNPAQQTTHYANFQEANPAWGNTKMAKETSVAIGEHTFSTPDMSRATMAPGALGGVVGPAGAVGVTGVSGATHSPGAMYGGMNTAGTPGGMAAAGANALGGALGLGGGFVDSGSISGTNTGTGATSMGQSQSEGTSSSANGNTAGSGDSSSSSSGNGNSSGSGGSGGSDGAGSGSSSGGSSGGLGGRGGDDDHDGGDGRGR